MTLRQFVRANRDLIDSQIVAVTESPIPQGLHNDDEREDWVLNDEGLYILARSEGVNI